MNQKIDKIIEEFWNKFAMYDLGYGSEGDEVEAWVRQMIQTAYQQGLQEAIDLSKKIEHEAEHTEFDEWKAFKRFRNTLRDLKKPNEGSL